MRRRVTWPDYFEVAGGQKSCQLAKAGTSRPSTPGLKSPWAGIKTP